MCGRFCLIDNPETLAQAFGYTERPNFPPRYNIAPTQPIATVIEERGARHFRLQRWGLLPGWLKDPKGFPLLINARGESVRTKASFRAAFRHRRCIVPASGWYEWLREGRAKTPFLIRRKSVSPMALAGVWECWHAPDGSEMDTVAIVTRSAADQIAHVHDRMPVILEGRDLDAWLGGDDGTPGRLDRAEALISGPWPDDLEAVKVSERVNKVANDGPEVMHPVSGGSVRRNSPGNGQMTLL